MKTKSLTLTAGQYVDLDECLSHLNGEVDDFQESWRDCLEAMEGKEKEYEAAVAALEKKLEEDGDTSEEMDALALVSEGHVYCAVCRMHALLAEQGISQ